jgi:hypothetical protein
MADRRGQGASTDADVPESTLADVRGAAEGPLNPWPHRIGLLVLFVVVVLGATGLLGVRSGTTSAHDNGYTLSVVYPHVSRAGLDSPFRIRVHADNGTIPGDITLGISEPWFRLFETQGFFPDADSSTNDGQFVYLTFSQPGPGHDFLLEYDAYIQPAAQLGKSATIVLQIDGHEVARTSLKTWLAP